MKIHIKFPLRNAQNPFAGASKVGREERRSGGEKRDTFERHVGDIWETGRHCSVFGYISETVRRHT